MWGPVRRRADALWQQFWKHVFANPFRGHVVGCGTHTVGAGFPVYQFFPQRTPTGGVLSFFFFLSFNRSYPTKGNRLAGMGTTGYYPGIQAMSLLISSSCPWGTLLCKPAELPLLHKQQRDSMQRPAWSYLRST